MSIIIVVMPKVEDAKKIRRILVNHGFTDTIFCPTGAGRLNKPIPGWDPRDVK